MLKKIIFIGAGGYAKSALDSLDNNLYKCYGFIDSSNQKSTHLGLPILGRKVRDVQDYQNYSYFISIGDNKSRKEWFELVKSMGLNVISIIDKTAIVSEMATLGEGCFVGKMAIINSMAEIKNNVIINTKALIEHGCYVSDHANISTNSVINGDVCVGVGTHIGSCSVVNGQLQIGNWSIIGSGAVVTRNVPEYSIFAGIPAKKIKDNKIIIK